MAEPLVSVLMPVYQAEATLRQTLESLRSQTLDRFEIVAVDDGSTDASPSILEIWQQTDPRLRTVILPHAGLTHALNRGLQSCTAPYVARMDADDLAAPERLEKQLRFMEQHLDISVLGTQITCFPEDQVGEGYRLYCEWQNALLEHEQIAREIFVESPLTHPSVMLRRDELLALGGYHDCVWAEDYDLWLRYFAAGRRFAKFPEVLLSWRQHPQRLTRTDSRYSVENFLRAKAHYLLAGALQDKDAVFVWGAGKTGRRNSKHLIRGGCTPEAFVDIDDDKIGGTLRRVPIIRVDELAQQWSKWQRPFLLAAVASRGARKLIREALSKLDVREGEHFLCVA